MKSIKGWLYVLFLLCSLVFVGITHRGSIVGDSIFRAIGIPPWSNAEESQGIHYYTIFGIVMVLISGNLTVTYFRQRYKKYVGRTVLISCIIFIQLYPFVTEQMSYLLYANKTGIEVVDLLKKDSRCTYNTQEDTVHIRCNLRVINYGGQSESMLIRPILYDNNDFEGIWSFVEVKHQEIILDPRSNDLYTIDFETKPDDRAVEYGAGGSTNRVGLEFVKDRQKKEVFTY